MNVQRKNKLITYTIISLIVAFFISGSVIRFAMLVLDDCEAQLKQNLKDVSNQCAETLSAEIDSRYDLLKSVNLRFEIEGDNSKNILDIYKPVVEAFRLVRIGYLDRDGIAYATDISGIDLSYRSYFKKSMSGDICISDILADALADGDENVTVITMPIRQDGRIIGISGITYDSEVLSEDIAVKSFDGYGDNFVINQNGTIVASSNPDILKTGESLVESDFETELDRNAVITSFVTAFASESPLDGTIGFDGISYYYQLTPIEIIDGNATWYMLSIVSDDYFMQTYNSIKRNLYRMIIIVSVFFMIGVLVIRYVYRKQRKATYKLAYCSHVTGGPNLERFFDTLRLMRNVSGYIVYMNLEDFTHTSVAMGLEMSNDIVKDVWAVIHDAMRSGEYACHDTADCFVMYMREESDEDIKNRLTILHDEIHERGKNEGVPWLNAKFGVCMITEDDSADLIYSKAEYTVFNTWGIKECVSFYNDADHEEQTLYKSLEESFDDALENKSFEVWFQPKYDVTGTKLTGAEALVRWRKLDGSLISPGIFIPLLEKNGDISRLDEYVFDYVCMKQKEWKDLGYEIVPVSINLSRASIYRDRIVDIYADIIIKHKIRPADVQIEVTETIVGENELVHDIISEFRIRGMKILMDDFGTGYSSLSTLNMKVFDTLKIDKSLTDEIVNDYGRTIVYHTIEMGNSLGLHITVEGVETEEQVEILKETKCDDIQGYYFSKPLPADEYEKKLR